MVVGPRTRSLLQSYPQSSNSPWFLDEQSDQQRLRWPPDGSRSRSDRAKRREWEPSSGHVLTISKGSEGAHWIGSTVVERLQRVGEGGMVVVVAVGWSSPLEEFLRPLRGRPPTGRLKIFQADLFSRAHVHYLFATRECAHPPDHQHTDHYAPIGQDSPLTLSGKVQQDPERNTGRKYQLALFFCIMTPDVRTSIMMRGHPIVREAVGQTRGAMRGGGGGRSGLQSVVRANWNQGKEVLLCNTDNSRG